MSSEVLRCEVLLVGLHAINDGADVKKNGRIECSAGTTLEFSRQPRFFQIDPKCVNVFASSGAMTGRLLGHLCVDYAEPMDRKHAISAIMDGDVGTLPAELHGYDLRNIVRFSGSLIQKTTHRPTGSLMAIVLSVPTPVDAVLVAALERWLRDRNSMMVQLL
jgi:hypothetical protein